MSTNCMQVLRVKKILTPIHVPVPMTSGTMVFTITCKYILSQFKFFFNVLKVRRLINLGLYAVLAIFQPYHDDWVHCSVWFWKFGCPWRLPVSLFFFEHQGNDLLRVKGVVILDTGHHLTSPPTDLKLKYKRVKQKYPYKKCVCAYVYIQAIRF
jgi:hypothetical protein